MCWRLCGVGGDGGNGGIDEGERNGDCECGGRRGQC